MKIRENLLLLLLVAGIAAFPLIWNHGADFGGADDKVQNVITEVRPEYKAWATPWWKPPSAEVESFLFAVQAALGAGFVGYWIGFQRGRRSGKTV